MASSPKLSDSSHVLLWKLALLVVAGGGGGGGAGVSTFNGRAGAVSLLAGDVTGALGFSPQPALGYTPENVANKSTDGTFAANSDVLYPSQKAAKTYADTKLALTGGVLTGDLDIGTVIHLEFSDGSAIFDGEITAGGGIDMLGTAIVNLLDPANPQDAATKAYVDGAGAGVYQPLDADLTAVAALATTGILARTGAGTWATRTITGTANQVVVANGDGVAGNPTLSLPQNIHTAATPQFQRLGLGAAASASHQLLLSGGTITTDQHQIDSAVTWNQFATNFTAWKLNVTNSSSAAGSLLLDLQLGGVSQFSVSRFGTVTAALDVYANSGYFTSSVSAALGLAQPTLLASDGSAVFANAVTQISATGIFTMGAGGEVALFPDGSASFALGDTTIAVNGDLQVGGVGCRLNVDGSASFADGKLLVDSATGSLSFSTGDPTIYQADASGSLRIGISGGNGAQFQIFGDTSGQLGESYFDCSPTGNMNFRFAAGLGRSLVLPATGDMDWRGFEVGNTPANAVTPAFWVQISIDAGTVFLPVYA